MAEGALLDVPSIDRVAARVTGRVAGPKSLTLLVVHACVLPLLYCTALAEPMLKRSVSKVSSRTTPPPLSVDSYEGKITQGHEQVHFLAPAGVVRWDAWSDPRYVAIAQEAIAIVERRAVGNPRCNAYFTTKMPKGKSFDTIWNSDGLERIRISFSPGPSGIWRAATYRDSAPFEWTITETTVLLGAESVASAMVHEATRTNGVGPEHAIAYGAEAACSVSSFLLTKGLLREMGWLVPKR